MAENLIIVRAGPRSLHNAWIGGATARSFDVFLTPYAPVSFVSEPENGISLGAVYPGLKWTGLQLLLNEWQGWRKYEYIALVDDDILASAADWNRFFEICAKTKVRLAQPALTQDSYFSHLITLQNKSFVLRQTTYVECMMPCFHRDALVQLLPTLPLNASGSGWGLEHLWAKELDNKGIWIVDGVPMRHTRPVASGYSGQKQQFAAEMIAMLKEHDAPALMRTLGGVTGEGKHLQISDPDFLRLYLSGYWELAKDNSGLFWLILRHQLGRAPGA